jgi:hypothetical protein
MVLKSGGLTISLEVRVGQKGLITENDYDDDEIPCQKTDRES